MNIHGLLDPSSPFMLDGLSREAVGYLLMLGFPLDSIVGVELLCSEDTRPLQIAWHAYSALTGATTNMEEQASASRQVSGMYTTGLNEDPEILARIGVASDRADTGMCEEARPVDPQVRGGTRVMTTEAALAQMHALFPLVFPHASESFVGHGAAMAHSSSSLGTWSSIAPIAKPSQILNGDRMAWNRSQGFESCTGHLPQNPTSYSKQSTWFPAIDTQMNRPQSPEVLPQLLTTAAPSPLGT